MGALRLEIACQMLQEGADTRSFYERTDGLCRTTGLAYLIYSVGRTGNPHDKSNGQHWRDINR
jgi:hypothetical protein